MDGLDSTWNDTDSNGPRQSVGRYEIIDQLGRGGFGAVYRARDPQLQRTVALKILMRASPKARQRFAREVQAVARLRHPHVVAIHDSGEEGGRPYLVMEFVQGQTLEALILDDALTLEQRVRLVRDVARAIQYAHDQGVLHRDLKPENVLVDKGDEPHVLDFGLAYLEEESGLQRLSISGVPMGTPAYMAPEQASGRRPDQRTDVWGLGAILYFTLVGEGPFESHSNPLLAVQNEPITPPRVSRPELPVAIERICMRCLSKRADDRYASAKEVADALSGFLARPAGGARDRAVRALVGVGGVVLAMVAGVAAFFLARGGSGGTSPLPTSVAVSPTEASTVAPTQTPAEVATTTPQTPQQAQVYRALDTARALGRQLLGSGVVRDELAGAARLAEGDRTLEEEVALALVEHHLRRRELSEGEAVLETRGWRWAVKADRLRLEFLALQNRVEEARRVLARLRRDDADGVGGALARAWFLLLDEDDLDGALLSGRRAVELDPDDVHARLFVAQMYSRRSDYMRELEHLSRAQSLAPDDYRVYRLLAEAYLQLDRVAEALRACDDQILLTKSHPEADAFASRGNLRVRTGRLEEGMADLNEAIRMEPDNFAARLHRGMHYLQREQFDLAEEDLRLARRSSPAVFAAVLEGAPRELADEVRRRIGIERQAWAPSEALLERLDLRAEQAEPRARPALREALRRAAGGLPWAAVRESIVEATDAAPDSPVVALERARLACQRDAYQDAERGLARARSLGAPAAELNLLEAELFERRGEPTEARARYRALKASQGPDSYVGLSAAAALALMDGDLQFAASLTERALEVDRRVGCLVIQVNCLLQNDQIVDAGQLAEVGIDAFGLIDSRLAVARYRTWLATLGQQIREEGRVSQEQVAALLGEFEVLKDLSEGAAALVMVASFLLDYPAIPGAIDLAQRYVKEAREREPERGEVFVQVARLMILRGDQDQTLEALRRARELKLQELPPGFREEFGKAFGDLTPLDDLF